MTLFDASAIQRNAITYDPRTARFVLENCILRRVGLDGDTVALLLEIGRTDKPNWTPRNFEQIMRDRLAEKGVQMPEPAGPPPVEGYRPGPPVEEREVEVKDEDEDER